MKNYFTVSEFAKLRNININSLRYYEKIGVLKPARIDENSGYRYYTADQLVLLDAIILCINAGIPLKDLTGYIENGGLFQNKELFETSKRVAQERIREIQTGLEKIEYTLRYFEANREYSHRTDLYERYIIERAFAVMEYGGELSNIKKIETASAELYNYAQQNRLSPVFPAGLILCFSGERVKTKVFFEIVGRHISDSTIVKIPEGRFLCRQLDMTPQSDLLEAIRTDFEIADSTEIIVSNMFQDKFQLGSRRSEIQVRIK